MTTPFVTELRTGDDVIVVGSGDGQVLHLRVQAAELWDTLRVDAAATEPVAAVKAAALEAFYPNGMPDGEFVVKLRGFEVLHENESLLESGVKSGSTLLVARRRRRPVR